MLESNGAPSHTSQEGLFPIGRCVWAAVLVVIVLGVSKASALPIRIMAIGDSITAGYTNNPTWTVPFTFGYRSGLYTRLTDAEYEFQFVGSSPEPWDDKYGLPSTVNPPDLRTVDQDYHRGYGGKGLSYLNSNIGSFLSADRPDLILLMIGINDISYQSSSTPTSQMNALDTLVNTIVTTKPNAHLIVAQITPYSAYTDAIVQYNTYIRETLVPYHAGLGHNVTTVDQYSNLLTGGTIDPSLFANGYNHPNVASYDAMAQTWFDMIETLDIEPEPPPGPYARGVLRGGAFESPVFAADSHNINPTNADWTFTPSTAGAGSGVDRGNPYGGTVTNAAPLEARQMGFLQGSGAGEGTTQITQDLTGLQIGRQYTLRFQAKGMQGFDGVNPFRVSLDGVDLDFGGSTVLSPSTSGESYNVTFQATAETMNLRFYDQGDVAVTQVSWIDDVTLGLVTAASANLVTNGGFETPVLAENSHGLNVAGAGWNFTTGRPAAGTGIDRGNPFGAACYNCTPYEGDQMAFIQGAGAGYGTSSIDQDVSGFEIGRQYVLTFEAKASGGDVFGGVNPLSVSIDGQTLIFDELEGVAPSLAYELFISDPFTATSETMNLRFFDEGNVDWLLLTWIDDVQITLASLTPGDATGDGVVDADDARRLATNWLQSGGWAQGDFNGDGTVDDLDASILAANWTGTSSEGAVPEPGTMALLLTLAGLSLMLKRR
ncbi:MAG: PEP-CTERM sorting domain-containing protein [Pirellulales bacterium]|nr:PEP-CTERM sorting domain-containing protein [Pirellulales bacterium]